MSEAIEINFDGLVGPTHNYAGLSEGNLASQSNRDSISRPRAAALQGLGKMRALMQLGLVQGVLPPHERPPLAAFRAIGFTGSDREVWEAAWRDENRLAKNATSASAMWAANAGTISPSADCADGRVHVSAANLSTMGHRALEAEPTTRALQRMFPEGDRFSVHDPLPGHRSFSDEGAANHMRMCAAHGAPGLEIFVYGRRDADPPRAGFPARQTLEAARAIARRHGLDPACTIFARQADEAIDAGAFHNDVVAVASERILFFHEQAFADRDALLAEIEAKAKNLFEPQFVEVSAKDVPLADAVKSYIFNTQLLRLPGDSRQTLIAPTEASSNARSAAYLTQLCAANGPIGAVRFMDVRESMKNGGGPACLRLRVALTPEERAAMRPGFILDEPLIARLEDWVSRRYREELAPEDLGDFAFLEECRAALDELTRILPLGGDFYPFQRG